LDQRPGFPGGPFESCVLPASVHELGLPEGHCSRMRMCRTPAASSG